MNDSIGDGIATLAVVGGIIAYLYMRYQTRQKRLEMIHQERMAAMEKGIPLPEFPLDPVREHRPDPRVLPILGMVLLTLSLGTMVVLYLMIDRGALAQGLPAAARNYWITPLPFAFLGAGLLAFHFLKADSSR